MRLEDAIACLKAAGYRVTKPKQTERKPLGLNAIGKPYGEHFDPKYRIKYHTPPLSRGNVSFPSIKPETWLTMCAKAEVNAIRSGLIHPSKARFNAPEVVAMLVVPKLTVPKLKLPKLEPFDDGIPEFLRRT